VVCRARDLKGGEAPARRMKKRQAIPPPKQVKRYQGLLARGSPGRGGRGVFRKKKRGGRCGLRKRKKRSEMSGPSTKVPMSKKLRKKGRPCARKKKTSPKKPRLVKGKSREPSHISKKKCRIAIRQAESCGGSGKVQKKKKWDGAKKEGTWSTGRWGNVGENDVRGECI